MDIQRIKSCLIKQIIVCRENSYARQIFVSHCQFLIKCSIIAKNLLTLLCCKINIYTIKYMFLYLSYKSVIKFFVGINIIFASCVLFLDTIIIVPSRVHNL